MRKSIASSGLFLALALLGACAGGDRPQLAECEDDWFREGRGYCDPALPIEERERRAVLEETLQNARDQLEQARKEKAPDAAEPHMQLTRW